MQHIKLPITRTNRISKPTVTDTINTGPAPAHTNTHIDYDSILLLLKDKYVTTYVKLTTTSLLYLFRTNWGIPLNQCLFVFTRTERNCSRDHEKFIPSLSEDNIAQEEQTLKVMCKSSLKGQACEHTCEDIQLKVYCTFRQLWLLHITERRCPAGLTVTLTLMVTNLSEITHSQ